MIEEEEGRRREGGKRSSSGSRGADAVTTSAYVCDVFLFYFRPFCCFRKLNRASEADLPFVSASDCCTTAQVTIGSPGLTSRSENMHGAFSGRPHVACLSVCLSVCIMHRAMLMAGVGILEHACATLRAIHGRGRRARLDIEGILKSRRQRDSPVPPQSLYGR